MRTLKIGNANGFILWPGDSDFPGDAPLLLLTGSEGARIRTKGADAGPYTPDELREIADRLISIANDYPEPEEPEEFLVEEPEEVGPSALSTWSGEDVKAFRQEHMTQKDLAEALGTSVTTLRKIENGEIPVSPAEMNVLDGLSSEKE